MITALKVIFWVAAGVVVYAYALYPVVVWVLSRVVGRRAVAPADPGGVPAVTLLIAAYNEEAVIEARIRNALATDYPAERFRVVIASDGSSDRTAAIASSFGDPRVRVLDYKARRGKASVLNSAMAEIDSEIVLLSDANTEVYPAAARRLVRWFVDPRVGAVCGRLVLVDPATGKNADGMYWKYETFLKKCAARLNALLGSNGAIYAIRRNVYVPIPGDTIVDDFVIPLLARLRHGCRIVYDEDAVASEESAEDVGAEFRRRSRIGAGGWQAIETLWPLLNPVRGWIAFVFLSHKVLRWACPFAMIIALVANAALWGAGPAYRVLLAVQVAFYAASLLAGRLHVGGPAGKVLRLASMFTNMNLALLVGFWRWARGSQKAAWERTVRAAAGSPDAAAETAAAAAAAGAPAAGGVEVGN